MMIDIERLAQAVPQHERGFMMENAGDTCYLRYNLMKLPDIKLIILVPMSSHNHNSR